MMISRKGIRGFCDRSGLSILETRGHPFYRQGKPALSLFVLLVSWLTFRTLEWRYNNLCYVLRRDGEEPMASAS